MTNSVKNHTEFVKQGTHGYDFQYQTIGGIKQGKFKKTYQEIIGCNHIHEKFITGEYKNGKIDNNYEVTYHEYLDSCPMCPDENDEHHDYSLLVLLNFQQGTIVSFNIKLNGQIIDQDSKNIDAKEKETIIALMDLDDDSKKYLCDQLGTNLPSNQLNRFFKVSDHLFKNQIGYILQTSCGK